MNVDEAMQLLKQYIPDCTRESFWVQFSVESGYKDVLAFAIRGSLTHENAHLKSAVEVCLHTFVYSKKLSHLLRVCLQGLKFMTEEDVLALLQETVDFGDTSYILKWVATYLRNMRLKRY